MHSDFVVVWAEDKYSISVFINPIYGLINDCGYYRVMDKLRAMQVFVRIAEEGSLTAAARAIESSLPATVRTLAAFEAALGVRLFNRTTRKISLTAEGQLHLVSSRQILSALSDAEASLNATSESPQGQLHITAPVLFGRIYVSPTITRFVQHHEKYVVL
jgi:DNA-binding transcriptional LysR family regulator